MTNTPWPDTVPVLSVFQTIDRQYGSPYEDGYPVDTLSWVEYSFPNHEHRIEFWKLQYRVYTVFEREREQLLNLMGIANEADHISKWNTRVRILWNTVMALLGYTENQSERALKVAEHLQTHTIFQKLEVIVGCRNGIFYPIARYLDGVEITVNKTMIIYRKEFNAEEETNQPQDYGTRPYVNRSTDTERQGTTSRRSSTRRIPTKPATKYKGNPALRRLMQADGA